MTAYVHYKIDEGSGTTVKAYDRDGNEIPASNGTITPDAAWTQQPEYSNNGEWTPDTDWQYIATKDPSLYAAPELENSIPQSWDLTDAAWTETGTSVAALDAVGMSGAPNTACTLTDDDGAAYEYVAETITVPNDSSSNTVRIFIKKDADETRHPSVFVQLTGGTSVSQMPIFSTKTGAVGGRVFNEGSDEFNLRGEYWEGLLQVDNNSSGNTSLTVTIYAARSSNGTSSATTATGSIIVGNVELHEGKTIAEVRGSAPIFTSGSAATTDAVQIAYDIANHSDEQGLYAAEWMPFISKTEHDAEGFSNNHILGSANSIAYVHAASTISSYDGATAIHQGGEWGAEYHSLSVAYGDAQREARLNGTAVEGAYDGAWVMGASLPVLSGNQFPALIRNVRRYNLPYEAAKAKAEELTSD